MRPGINNVRAFIESSNIGEENKKTLLWFDMKNASDISKLTREMHLRFLFKLAKYLKEKPFMKATADDIDNFIFKVTEGEFSRKGGRPKKGEKSKKTHKPPAKSTVNQLKISIIKLYRTLFSEEVKEGKKPDAIMNVKARRVVKEGGLKDLQREDLFVPSEIEQMVRAVQNIKWKAAIKVLYESGFRVNEFLSMTVGSVKMNGKEAIVRINASKTRTREVPIIYALPELKAWLNQHPRANESKAPLWTNTKGNVMCRMNVKYMLEKAAKRAGIEKHINPHLLRHSVINWRKRNGMVREELCFFAGWSQKSYMPEHYSHFGSEDMLNRVRIQGGISVDDPQHVGWKRAFETCPQCKRQYPVGHLVCTICNISLDETKYAEMLREAREQKQVMDNVKVVEPLIETLLPSLQRLADRGISIDKLGEILERAV